MGCIAGRLAGVKISPDNGATYLPLGGIVDQSLSLEVDQLECTSHDSGGTREYEPNFASATAELSLRWDEDNAAQLFLEDSVLPTPIKFKMQFYLEQASGRKLYNTDAFVTNWTASGNLDDTAGLSVSLQLSNLTSTTQ